ncbi:choice-of-anchor D domain-containing protein [bacterium]|nr:MAG: choice-of-anchor D domain-containing protein [bacterium]RIK64082.1 MAG: hypothetical protein DCC64_05060 [Planctomycetota bacterium]
MRLAWLVALCAILNLFVTSARAQTFTSSGAVAIPDTPSNGVESAIAVSGVSTGSLYPRMRVTLTITHGACDHLDIFLLPPGVNWPGGVISATSQATAIGAGVIELSTDNMGGGANYTGTQFVVRGDNNFDPTASATPITSATAPATGLFTPEGQHLFGTAIYFMGANGSWRLAIIDDTPGVSGTLVTWSIEFGVPTTAEAALLDFGANNSQYATSGEIANGTTYNVPFTAKTGSTQAVRLYWCNFGSVVLSANSPVISNMSNCSATLSGTGPLPAATAPGTYAALVFSVTPTSPGTYSFVFTCSTGDLNESPYSFAVTGAALALPSIPEIQVERPNGAVLADGGTDFVGATSPGTPLTLTYTVRNRSAYSLSLTTPLAAPASTVNCSAVVTTQPPAIVGPGYNVTFAMEVVPAAPGVWSFTWSLWNNDPDEDPYDLTVTGTAVAPPPECDVYRGTAVADGSVDTLGASTVGVPVTLSYVIANTVQHSTLTLGAMVVGATASNCSATIVVMPAVSIAGGATDLLVIELTALGAGPFSCSVSFTNNDSNENPYDWTIAGTATPPPLPECDVWRGSLAIADGSVDTQGALAATVPHTVTYTIENSGTAALILNGAPQLVVVTPGSNVIASVTISPSATVAAQGTTLVEITFTVLANGPFDFQISFDSNDTDENPYQWTVSGNGTAAPEIGVTRDQVTASVVVYDGGDDDIGDGVSGSPLTLTYSIANTGNAPLNLTLPVSVTGASNCTVAVTAQPNAVVPAGSSTTLVFVVTPLTAQSFSFSVSIANDDPNENPYNWTARGQSTSIGGFSGEAGGGGGCSTGDGTPWTPLMHVGLVLLVMVAARRRRHTPAGGSAQTPSSPPRRPTAC